MYPGKLVPDWFEVPERVEIDGVVLTPIPLENWLKDVHAIRELRDYYERNPAAQLLNPGLQLPDDIVFAMSDVCWMYKLWRLRASFAYGIMTEDESVELGCLYVFATRKRGYDAEVVSWMREENLQPLGEKLYEFAESWIPEVWPFTRVTWPRREVSWQDWYRLPDKDPQNWPGNPTYSLVPRRLVPNSFEVPTKATSKRFTVVPLQLSMDAVAKNYDAYMSSVDHLKGLIRPDDHWPEGATLEDAIIDVGYFHFLWHLRGGFAYSFRDPEDTIELGCLYIVASHKHGHDAEAYAWARESGIEKGLDEEIYAFSRRWIRDEWPFQKVAWPGREIDWVEWAKLPEWETNRE